MTFMHKDPLGHKDFKFINAIYFSSLDMLMQLDKDLIRHALRKAKLVCRPYHEVLRHCLRMSGVTAFISSAHWR